MIEVVCLWNLKLNCNKEGAQNTNKLLVLHSRQKSITKSLNIAVHEEEKKNKPDAPEGWSPAP